MILAPGDSVGHPMPGEVGAGNPPFTQVVGGLPDQFRTMPPCAAASKVNPIEEGIIGWPRRGKREQAIADDGGNP